MDNLSSEQLSKNGSSNGSFEVITSLVIPKSLIGRKCSDPALGDLFNEYFDSLDVAISGVYHKKSSDRVFEDGIFAATTACSDACVSYTAYPQVVKYVNGSPYIGISTEIYLANLIIEQGKIDFSRASHFLVSALEFSLMCADPDTISPSYLISHDRVTPPSCSRMLLSGSSLLDKLSISPSEGCMYDFSGDSPVWRIHRPSVTIQ